MIKELKINKDGIIIKEIIMLKTITMITKFILIALTVLLFASCNQSINKAITEVDMLLRTELWRV
jgi:hypothetical protein